MKKTTVTILLITALIASLSCFGSLCACSARISGQVEQGAAGNFILSANLQPRVAALIRSFQALAGGEGTSPIDGAAISQSLAEAPGIDSVALRNTAPEAVEGPLKISRIGDFLSSPGAAGIVRFEQSGSGGRCVISLTREQGPHMLSLLSPEIAAYLEVLMSPLATGEELNKAEYLELIATVYGKPIADEIARSSIRASIDFPGTVQSVKGGTFKGRRAELEIPLVDLLVLEKPLSYEIVWNK